MTQDIMAEMVKFYRVEVKGKGPFKGVIVHKTSGKKMVIPAQYPTASGANLATLAVLTGAIKRGEIRLA